MFALLVQARTLEIHHRILSTPTPYMGQLLYGSPTFPRPPNPPNKAKRKPFYSTLGTSDNKAKKEVVMQNNGTQLNADTIKSNHVESDYDEEKTSSDSDIEAGSSNIDSVEAMGGDNRDLLAEVRADNRINPGWKLHTYFEVCRTKGSKKRDWNRWNKYLGCAIAPELIGKLQSGYYPVGTKLYTDGTLMEE